MTVSARPPRLLIFLGVFSTLLVLLLLATSAAVMAGVIRTEGHVTIGLAAALPVVAYQLLSLRHLLRRGEDPAAPKGS